ncbi:MAG TPA: endonuclease III [Thermoplasmata archaeon]|nr:endonuclease III [Thermoplasmata archaeon]
MGPREKAVYVMRALRRRYLGESTFLENPGTTLATVAAETEDPFRVLISTILSHRTRDERTAEASRRLFARYRTPRRLAAAPVPEIRRLIRGVNFHVGKAQRLKEVARYLLRYHRGEVPREYEDLLEIPMVGPKTANCVLVYGFGVAAIPVDTHCHRVPNRLGFVRTKRPEETEAALKRLLPREYWLDVNELVIRFGKEVCRPRGPRCSECDFTAICMFYRRQAGRPPRALPVRRRLKA